MKQTAVEWYAEQAMQLEIQRARSIISISQMLNELSNILDQAKAMEKEQMINFAEFVATYTDKNTNINGEMLHAKSKYDGAERTIDLLNQYYESKTNL